MTIDLKVQPRERESIFNARCRVVGVDPNKTSLHALECYERGLDPEKTSIHDLKRAGSQLYKN